MSPRSEHRNRITQIISAVSGYPASEIVEEILIRDELLIDSIKQMEIIARVENQFQINLDEGRLTCMETVGDFFDMVLENISKAS